MRATRKQEQDRQPILNDRSGKAKWSRVRLVVLGMALALMITSAGSYFRFRSRPSASSNESEKPAPWGVLEEKTVMLEPPVQFFWQYAPAHEIRWVFGKSSPQDFQKLIQSIGLPQEQQAALLDQGRWQLTNNAIVVHPPLDLVRDMDAGPRQRLYSTLALTEDNLAQRFPYAFRGRFEDRFDGCEVSSELLKQLRRMLYKKGDAFVFADLPYFQVIASSNEVCAIARRLACVPALVVDLRVNENSDLQGLMHYWALPERSAKIEPLLDSLSHVPGGAALDVSHFLPPVANSLLYNYPHPRGDDLPANANCVWSAMNFFNTQPDQRFFDEQFTGQALNLKYHRVPSADAFGDVIMLYKADPDGAMRMIHMCVHIADDVVFTKNGGDVFQPWVLMRLPDVEALFAPETGLRTAVFRRKT